MGSIIMDNAIINQCAIIGAGALVAPNTIIPENTLALGIPAKPIRQISNKEFEEILESSKHYIEFSKKYMNQK